MDLFDTYMNNFRALDYFKDFLNIKNYYYTDNSSFSSYTNFYVKMKQFAEYEESIKFFYYIFSIIF